MKNIKWIFNILTKFMFVLRALLLRGITGRKLSAMNACGWSGPCIHKLRSAESCRKWNKYVRKVCLRCCCCYCFCCNWSLLFSFSFFVVVVVVVCCCWWCCWCCCCCCCLLLQKRLARLTVLKNTHSDVA